MIKKSLPDFKRIMRLRAGGLVKRFHTFPTVQTQSVAAHTHNVLVLCLQLNPCCSASLIQAICYHDLAEYDTGDTPAPAKWKSRALNTALNNLEDEINVKLEIDINLTTEEEWWLRLCDTLDYMLFACEERSLGNINANLVMDRGMARVTSSDYKGFIESLDKQTSKRIDDFINGLYSAYSDAVNGKMMDLSLL